MNNNNNNNALNRALFNPNDEFYTQYEDIEKELSHYLNCFKNKIIFLNCADANKNSDNFYRYFKNNFNVFHYKEVIALEYNPGFQGKCFIYNGVVEKEFDLEGDGGYDSIEGGVILEKVDIVITNPPFSKIKNFVPKLINANKDFLLVAPLTSLSYLTFFEHVKSYKVHAGYTTPKFFTTEASKPKRFGNIIWITTLPIEEKKFLPIKAQNLDRFNYYDNYPNILNIDRLSDIPNNYSGIMGVPITFLSKYNPKQFELIGTVKCHTYETMPQKINGKKKTKALINGKEKFERCFVRLK